MRQRVVPAATILLGAALSGMCSCAAAEERARSSELPAAQGDLTNTYFKNVFSPLSENPQGLKPAFLLWIGGTAKAVPFHREIFATRFSIDASQTEPRPENAQQTNASQTSAQTGPLSSTVSRTTDPPGEVLQIEGVSDGVQRRSLLRAGVVLTVTPDMIPQERNFRRLDAHLKLRMALRDSIDPGTLTLTAINAAINTGTDSDNAFGEGWAGFSRRIGTYTTDDYSSEFFQTFFFPAIFRQDPRYHRIPYAPIHVRLMHALTHVLVSQTDNMHPCPNYGELLGTIASSTLTNVYHEGQAQGFEQTARRDLVSVGSDAAWDVFNEFLPDLVRHIKIRNIFLQRIAFEATR